MSKSILCAIDISNPGVDTAVLQRAAEIAVMDGVSLDVVTVVPDYGMSVVGSFFNEEHHDAAVADAKKSLDKEVSKALSKVNYIKGRHIVTTGKAYSEVLHVAKEAKTSLIVVGSHNPELKDYLLGPNAARIVRHANCSVYVVR